MKNNNILKPVLTIIFVLAVVVVFVSLTKPKVSIPDRIEIQEDLIDTENISNEETGSIVTPAYIVRFDKEKIVLDFATDMNAREYISYKINKGDCSLPGMSKSEAIAYATEQLESFRTSSQTEEVQIGIDLIDKNCNLDGHVITEFGVTVNQSSTVRSFPIGNSFKINNSCRDEITLQTIFSRIPPLGDEVYEYHEYGTYGMYIPVVTIKNGEVIGFDFVNGCAG